MRKKLRKKLFKLYPDAQEIYGPYITKQDGRKRAMIYIDQNNKITKQYAKFKMEAKLGRVLSRNETVNHIDHDPTNDRYSNLEICSHRHNVQLAHKKGAYKNNYAQTSIRMRGNTIGQGEGNGKAKLTSKKVIKYRRLAEGLSKRERVKLARKLAVKNNCSYRTIQNMLKGISYFNV